MKDFMYLMMVIVLLPLLIVGYMLTKGKDQSEINAKWDGVAE